MSEKNVIQIRVAGEDEPGSYYLILRKGTGLFSASGSVTYSVDYIAPIEDSKGNAVFLRAFRMEGEPTNKKPVVVCAFPLGANFEMVLKSQTNRLSEVEFAQMQKDLEKKLEEIMGPDETLVLTSPTKTEHAGYL